MKAESVEIQVSGLSAQVVRKRIKNVHLRVYPPDGRVRLSVPLHLGEEAIRQVLRAKLGWIQKQRATIAAQAGAAPRQLVSGETLDYLGRPYRLQVVERPGPNRVELRKPATLELQVRPGADCETRQRALDEWYRQRLCELVPPLLARWESILGVRTSEWRVRKMKTRWGSCSVKARRIWLNLVLAKKPEPCLELIIVHELLHLIERRHNARFRSLLDLHLPAWRQTRRLLRGL